MAMAREAIAPVQMTQIGGGTGLQAERVGDFMTVITAEWRRTDK